VLVRQVLEVEALDARVRELAEPLDSLLRRPGQPGVGTPAKRLFGILVRIAEPTLDEPRPLEHLAAVGADDTGRHQGEMEGRRVAGRLLAGLDEPGPALAALGRRGEERVVLVGEANGERDRAGL